LGSHHASVEPRRVETTAVPDRVGRLIESEATPPPHVVILSAALRRTRACTETLARNEGSTIPASGSAHCTGPSAASARFFTRRHAFGAACATAKRLLQNDRRRGAARRENPDARAVRDPVCRRTADPSESVLGIPLQRGAEAPRWDSGSPINRAGHSSTRRSPRETTSRQANREPLETGSVTRVRASELAATRAQSPPSRTLGRGWRAPAAFAAR
jgi:hypothetical protein